MVWPITNEEIDSLKNSKIAKTAVEDWDFMIANGGLPDEFQTIVDHADAGISNDKNFPREFVDFIIAMNNLSRAVHAADE